MRKIFLIFFVFILISLIFINGCETTPTGKVVQEVVNEDKTIKKDIPISPEKEIPTKIRLICPASCNDQDSCTIDYCNSLTNYKCVHKKIFPCCGNDICESTETYSNCPNDCPKPKCDTKYLNKYRCDGNLREQKYQFQDCLFSWVEKENCPYGCFDGKCKPKPKKICTADYLNEIGCSDNWIQRKYQYEDCNVDWIKVEYCSYGCSNGKCNSKPQQYSYNMSLCTGSADCFIGKVTYIVDGDTLDVDGVRIRLALTNTPESWESGFTEAKQFTENLCPVGSLVLVDEDDGQTAGSYDRTIAVVYCGKYNLNEKLLELGYGQIWTTYCQRSEFSNEDWAVKFGC